MSSDSAKTCTRCGKPKPADAFPLRSVRGVQRRSPRCRECIREVDRERSRRYRTQHADEARAANRDAQRRASARRFGLSLERADQLRAGPCGICGTAPEDGCQVYQDKATGAVLGGLCRTCLRGLAMLGGTPERLTSALSFVQSPDLREESQDA